MNDIPKKRNRIKDLITTLSENWKKTHKPVNTLEQKKSTEENKSNLQNESEKQKTENKKSDVQQKNQTTESTVHVSEKT